MSQGSCWNSVGKPFSASVLMTGKVPPLARAAITPLPTKMSIRNASVTRIKRKLLPD